MARPELLTIREVAALVRLSVKTVRRAIASGELVASKVRGRWLVTVPEVNAWIERARFVPPSGTGREVRMPAPDRGSLAALRRIDSESGA
jgi:excisionase family DNA binding protein